LVPETLLILPCNRCVRLGDYSLCQNWRVVFKHVGFLVESGALGLAAIDSCKPGIVLWGEERNLTWCDINPRWDKLYGRDPDRLELLVQAIARDLRELSLRYKTIAYYVNVKAYRLALEAASKRMGVELLDLGPPKPNPLSYNKHAKEIPEKLLKAKNFWSEYKRVYTKI
jgi:hypothetical protein